MHSQKCSLPVCTSPSLQMIWKICTGYSSTIMWVINLSYPVSNRWEHPPFVLKCYSIIGDKSGPFSFYILYKTLIILLKKYQCTSGKIKIVLIFFSGHVKTWEEKKEHKVKEMFFSPKSSVIRGKKPYIYICIPHKTTDTLKVKT